MPDVQARKREFLKLERLSTTVNNIDPNAVTEGEIKIYLKTADAAMWKIEEYHVKVLAVLTDDQDLKDQEDVFIPMEQLYQDIMAKLYNFQSTSPAPRRTQQHLRLPDIQLPSFDGKYEDWPSFSDLFTATVENNAALSSSQKLQCLKSCVKGEAHNMIKTFTVTDFNYQEAWTLLSDRYSNTREIVTSLVRKLFHQPSIKTDSIATVQSLLNTTLECLRSLKVLGRPTDKWDDLVTFIVIDKLDSDTKSEWARSLKGKDPATFKDVQEFLEQHIRSLHARGSIKSHTLQQKSNNNQGQGKQFHHVSQQSTSCQICKESHYLYQCPKLKGMTVDKRLEAVKATKACLNCLKDGHMSKDCTSTSTCKRCSKKHNTFLHIEHGGYKSNKQINTTQIQSPPDNNSANSQSNIQINSSSCSASTSTTLLKTALADVLNYNGEKRQIRIFLDDGGEGSLIKESTMNYLGLPKKRVDINVTGVGGTHAMKAKFKTHVRLFSKYNDSFIDVELFAVPQITGRINNVQTASSSWTHLEGLQLADPFYNLGGNIDILIGADTVPYILLDGIKQANRFSPVAQNTTFGWVLFGNTSSSSLSSNIKVNTCEISSALRRFWEIEEVPTVLILTTEEADCEKDFLANTLRNNDGRFVVKLPFNENKTKLGSTREVAYRRFIALERRFIRQPENKEAYINFMREYESLGHMEKATTCDGATYLPHHYVLKDDSTTTKQRTVFDGSAKSSTGISLNDTLLVGATVQPDLFTLLLRFRLKKVALKADIAKMYRQFLVADEDRDYQRIFWRENSNQPIQEYRLCTVTYGTACAPYLATRFLNKLAEEVGDMFPKAAKAIFKHTYVDDFIGCADTIQDAQELVKQLVSMTSTAGMEIRKWCSNYIEALLHVPDQLREDCSSLEFKEGDSNNVKALGIKWTPSSDSFSFTVTINKTSILTKRHILSEVAKTFDPIGWLTPVTIKAKLLLQRLWLENKHWDEQISSTLVKEWIDYQENLVKVDTIKIPRCVVSSVPDRYELHGFSDSSEAAMASSVFLKSVHKGGHVTVNLLASKSKVAPLKAVSLPKLELSAAKLLAELITAVNTSLELETKQYCWTDSTITLHWITSHSRRWKTFVANRVSAIQTLTPPELWHHVRSQDNPAALPSRGITTAELATSELWCHGPSWLQTDTYPVYPQNYNEEELRKEERSKQLIISHSAIQSTHSKLFSAFSSFSKLCRIYVYLIRFTQFIRKQKVIRGPPYISELNEARLALIRLVQKISFPNEYLCLGENIQLDSRSKLIKLNPLLDHNLIITVGGRIERADLPVETRHPVILPHNHPISLLIINDTHKKTLHGGFTLTLATVRQTYWILRARDLVRYNLRKCITCRRNKAIQQQMGILPSARVQSTKVFLHSGVDFAGPFHVKVRKGRYYNIEKCYFAIFVCMATKAIHLESVNDLTSEAFIACFERFIARRGCCGHLYSDNGTNFIGANKIMKTFYKEQATKIQQQLCNHGTQWHFNPPASPHHGGLWEAGVKSVKYHFQRVVGQSVLVMDQFQTLLCKIEGCLNSRPLCAMSVDPTDLEALTPGHFLVGGPINAIPEPDVTLVKQNRLSFWETVRQLSQSFWKRWSAEYVTTLQQRFKWTRKQTNLQEGDLVVIMDETLPLTKWKLGRVIVTHPGDDGLVRAVTVKTATGELKRSMKLCFMTGFPYCLYGSYDSVLSVNSMLGVRLITLNCSF